MGSNSLWERAGTVLGLNIFGLKGKKYPVSNSSHANWLWKEEGRSLKAVHLRIVYQLIFSDFLSFVWGESPQSLPNHAPIHFGGTLTPKSGIWGVTSLDRIVDSCPACPAHALLFAVGRRLCLAPQQPLPGRPLCGVQPPSLPQPLGKKSKIFGSTTSYHKP